MTSIGCGAEPQPYPPAAREVAHGLPTLEQQEAIALLSGQDVDDVFAYLKYARSAIRNPQSYEGSRGEGTGLSLEQVDAIKTLSGCADRKLRTWLRDDRVASKSLSFYWPRRTSLTAFCRRFWDSR